MTARTIVWSLVACLVTAFALAVSDIRHRHPPADRRRRDDQESAAWICVSGVPDPPGA